MIPGPPVGRPPTPRGRWTSFVADRPSGRRNSRALHEENNPQHLARAEHDDHTILLHLSDEDGPGWTTVAVDRATRVAVTCRGASQALATAAAIGALYGDPPA